MRGQFSPPTGAWRGHILAGLLFAGLALVATWPLPADVTEAVPFSHTTAGGVGRVALFPGDTLDTLYKLWMVGEQVTGRVPLMTDPYQFQGKGITPPFVPQDFPFALLFVALSPLGIAAAYNLCLWATFVLTGLSTRWWLRIEGAGEAGALLGAGIFTLLPFRLAQLKGGHFNAFVVFLLPLAAGGAAMLVRGNRPVRGGTILGGSLLLMAMMEFHLFYYAALVLAVLVPLRLLGGGAAAGSPACLLHVFPGAMLASGALARWSGRPVSWATLAGALGMGVAAAVLLPAVLPADPSERRRALARGHLALLPWYIIAAAWVAGRHPGERYALMAFLWTFVFLVRPAIKVLRRVPRRVWAGIAVAALLAIMGVCWLLWIRQRAITGSVAGEGRSYREVSLFAPRPADFLARTNPLGERYIYPGLLALLLAAAAGLASPGRRIAWAGAMTLGWLSLGPSGDDWLPLYRAAYEYIPHFNLPRVPGRIFPLAALALAALAAFGADRLTGGRRWKAGLLLALVLIDFRPGFTTALTVLPRRDGVMARAALGLRPGERVLHLPLWPGDSADTTLYLFRGAMLHRVPMLNGYSPLVTPTFRDQVFQQLAPLTVGDASPAIRERLQEHGVRYLVVHRKAFPAKVSAFPPSLTVDRLEASGWLTRVAEEEDRVLFELSRTVSPGAVVPLPPIGAAVEAEALSRSTGSDEIDPSASGGAFRRASSPGYPVFRGVRWHPSGDYVGRFLVRTEGAVRGRVEALLARGGSVLGGIDLPADTAGGWVEVTFPFRIDSAAVPELRCRLDGGGRLDLDWLAVTPRNSEATDAWEAESLFGVGVPVTSPGASGGRVVDGGDLEPVGPLVWGPDMPLPPGAYTAVVTLSGGSATRRGGGPGARVTVGEPGRPASLGAKGSPDPWRGDPLEITVPFTVGRLRPVRVTVERRSGRIEVDRVAVRRERN